MAKTKILLQHCSISPSGRAASPWVDIPIPATCFNCDPLPVQIPPTSNIVRFSPSIPLKEKQALVDAGLPTTYKVCPVCHRPTTRLDLCPSCFNTHRICVRCKTHFKLQPHNNNYGIGVSGLCPTCSETHFICQLCGKLLSKQDYTPSEKNVCLMCQRKDSEEIHSTIYVAYGCTPHRLHFHTMRDESTYEKTGNLYMGMELETEYTKGENLTRQRAEALYSLHLLSHNRQLFYMATDASLKNGGIELITTPCTLEYHQTKFPWQAIHDTIKANQGCSHHARSAGIHIHFSRNFLGEPQTLEHDMNVVKLTYIFEQHWGRWTKFSRRTPEQMNSWAARLNKNDGLKLSRGIAKANAYNIVHNNGGVGRHAALNFGNTNTIEVRFMRGSYKVDTILACFEMVDYIVRWIKPRSLTTIQQATWPNIWKGISPRRYPHLLSYLKRKNLLKESI